MRLLLSAFVALALAVPALAGCGGGEEAPDPAEQEREIEDVMLENEIGDADRCERIYTDHYLERNWNKHVTAYGGETPLEKCMNNPPPPTVTEDQVKIEVVSVDGDTAVATSKVGAYKPLGYALVRDPASGQWQIDDFSE
jgi:hypothetical protein